MGKTAIVVLNFNDVETTKTYIDKIGNYSILHRIIIVDNCSTDGSYETLKKYESEKIKIIQTDCNRGYSSGNNYGLMYLLKMEPDLDYVIISNPDIIIEEKSIATLVQALENSPNSFATSGEVYTVNGLRTGGFRYKLPTTRMLFLESSPILRRVAWKCFNYGRRYVDDHESRVGDKLMTEALPGCFFVADFSKFKQLSFFDPDTFLYYEEDILFSKAKRRGFDSFVVKDVTLVHAEGVSIKKNIKAWSKRERMLENSCTIYMKKSLNVSNALINVYKIWNRLFTLERYLNMKFRTKYN